MRTSGVQVRCYEHRNLQKSLLLPSGGNNTQTRTLRHATSRQSSCRNAHLAISANMTQEVTFITSMFACCGTGCQLNGQPNCTISEMMPRPIALRPG